MNQNDDKAIFDLMVEWGTTGTTDTFRRSVVEYIATIRQEERRAALDQACRVICPRCSLPESYAPAERIGNGKRWFHRAINTSFEQGIATQCDAWTIRNLTLETAETREDGDDGDNS